MLTIIVGIALIMAGNYYIRAIKHNKKSDYKPQQIKVDIEHDTFERYVFEKIKG